jgi:hypothetical protein
VGASYGAVLLPIETSDPSEALRLADQRMYAQKSSSRLSAPRQTTDVLLQMIAEHDPELCDHASEVAVLAEAVAARLGMPSDQIVEVKSRREPARRGQDRHTGEHPRQARSAHSPRVGVHPPAHDHRRAHPRRRSLALELRRGRPRLARVLGRNRLPDRLEGESIPVEARVIAVCDAYHAMTSPRPYASSRTPAEAFLELQRCAGTQFDPEIVRALVAELAGDTSQSASALSA